ncbi:MAG: PHP domain-containing protein [Thermodesulforhabdaceae bacterium]
MTDHSNKDLGELFRLTAVMLEIMDENVFRSRAFERAASIVESLQEDVCLLAKQGELETLAGIGKAIARYISEWCTEGTFSEYEKLKKNFPAGLLDLLRIPGLGSKKVKALYIQLGITSLGELEYACLENRLVSIKGFGLRSQEKILSAIENLKKIQKFRHAPDAYAVADEILSLLRDLKSVRSVTLVGALRRFQEYTDDVDILIDVDGSQWIDELARVNLLQSFSILFDEFGYTRVVGNFQNMVVDIRQAHGAGPLVVYTGNKDHVRDLGVEPGYLLLQKFADEAELYGSLGLSFIPPELREGLGEVEFARKNEIPILIEERDIKGIFHIHTTASDGALELERIVRICLELGYEYVGISDHSVSAAYAGGLTGEKLKRQREEVEIIRERYPQIDIYWGIESDIRPDGSLDYPDRILESFDFVIGSIHSHFKMDRKTMTDRILKALSHPCLTMLGHPTGRLLLARPGYDVDMDAVLEKAKEYGKILELNSHPYRLDIDWKNCRKAKALGIPVSINPDAHNRGDFYLRYGILTARKGWLSAGDVWNTKDRASMKKLMLEKPWKN